MKRATFTAVTVLAFAIITLLPGVAAACPVCAADNGQGTIKLLAVFLAVPFVIAAVIIPMIVRAVRQAGP